MPHSSPYSVVPLTLNGRCYSFAQFFVLTMWHLGNGSPLGHVVGEPCLLADDLGRSPRGWVAKLWPGEALVAQPGLWESPESSHRTRMQGTLSGGRTI